MARVHVREVRRERGTCLSCHAEATLVVKESRYERGWRHRLDARFDPQASRTATCSQCTETYPIRMTDDTAAGGSRRGEGEGLHRDWDYQRTA